MSPQEVLRTGCLTEDGILSLSVTNGGKQGSNNPRYSYGSNYKLYFSNALEMRLKSPYDQSLV